MIKKPATRDSAKLREPTPAELIDAARLGHLDRYQVRAEDLASAVDAEGRNALVEAARAGHLDQITIPVGGAVQFLDLLRVTGNYPGALALAAEQGFLNQIRVTPAELAAFVLSSDEPGPFERRLTASVKQLTFAELAKLPPLPPPRWHQGTLLHYIVAEDCAGFIKGGVTFEQLRNYSPGGTSLINYAIEMESLRTIPGLRAADFRPSMLRLQREPGSMTLLDCLLLRPLPRNWVSPLWMKTAERQAKRPWDWMTKPYEAEYFIYSVRPALMAKHPEVAKKIAELCEKSADATMWLAEVMDGMPRKRLRPPRLQ